MEILILLGAPGSGKGTVAARLAEKVRGFETVSSGALLRAAVRDRTPAGQEAEACLARGELVSDRLIASMIDAYLAGRPATAFVALDGFPRTVAQAEMLETILSARGAVLRRVVFLDATDDVVLARLGGRRVCPACAAGYHVVALPPKRNGVCDACGTALETRTDDRPETIAHRLQVYTAQTAPLIDWYAARGLLARVPASGRLDEIAAQVERELT